jgi:prepilin-type N-terminal cleavage/methylation domain-containing protein
VKRFKAYTLLEVLVVISIMLIIMGVGITSYLSFAEVTKFNQDVANIQNDISVIQRAAMLFKKDVDERWLYGLGIDFGGLYVAGNEKSYTFFKWCSQFDDYGNVRTRSEYPNFDPTQALSPTNGNIPLTISSNPAACDVGGLDSVLVPLTEYGQGKLNSNDVTVSGSGDSGDVRFILFEAVSGRTFVYLSDGTLDTSQNIYIDFDKNVGSDKRLIIKNLTGRTVLLDIE